MRLGSVVHGAAIWALLATGCANDFDSTEDSGPPPAETGAPEGGPSTDIFPSGPVEISGVVRAPDGKMPISGALVYITTEDPPPIPDKVYCDKCVELPASTPHTQSGPDGSFVLKVPYKGKWLLVTQKGAFRRARWIDVPVEGMTVDQKLTTLPAVTDAAKGDFIPKMAVIDGAWDAIENSLAKLGLGQVDANGALVPGTESFTMYKCKLISIFPPRTDCNPTEPSTLLKDYDELAQYHILFVPCDSEWLDGTFINPETKKTLVQWISDGGRLYVTDYQYDLINAILPGYITWEGQSSTMGSAELETPYDAQAKVVDADMSKWLAAQGITSFKLLESYTIIKSVAKLPTPGPDVDPGKYYSLGPKVWVEGDVPGHGWRPCTVSFPYGCGRVLFSTYHTEGDKSTGNQLLAQEQALLYVLLEVAVCIKEPVVE